MAPAPSARILVVFAAVAAAPLCVAGQPPHLPLVPLERAERSLVVALDPTQIAAMAGRTALTIDLPAADGRLVTVRLERFDVLPPGVTPQAASMDGGAMPLENRVQLWRGDIEGLPDSRVYIGFAPGVAQGFIDTGADIQYIATPQGSAVTLITAATDFDPNQRLDVICNGALIPPGMDLTIAEEESGGYAPRGGPCRVLEIAIDADVEFGELFPTTQMAADYIQLLMGAVSSIYRAETDSVLISPFVRIWEETDPWTAESTSPQLSEFRSWWRSNMQSQPRSLAHLLSGRSLGGGVAWVRQACSTNYGYAVSANMRGSFPFPIQDNNSSNWDLMVVAHELGHNLGTGHTHDPNSYSPIIDGCGSDPRDCTVASAGEGTIMSYCHTCSGGMRNMRMRFGPRVDDTIRNYINGPAAGCGTTQSPPTLLQQPAPVVSLCPGSDLRLEVTATGTSIRYQWSRNGSPIPDATGPVYTVPAAQLVDSGLYACTIRNDCGELTSEPASVLIVTTPSCQPCPADWDGSGGVDGDDIAAFFSDWQSGSADIDQSGGTDGDDITFFFARWQSGC